MPDPRNSGQEEDSALESALDSILEVDGLGGGGFQPVVGGVGMPEPIPAATPENLICLRGPCRYYHQATQFFGAGNPKGTPGVKNELLASMCTFPVGSPIDLTDECVFDCNKWDPDVGQAREERDARRELWRATNPDAANKGGNGHGA